MNAEIRCKECNEVLAKFYFSEETELSGRLKCPNCGHVADLETMKPVRKV